MTLPTISVPTSTNGSQSTNYFPAVDVVAPTTADQGENVTLNGTATYDPDGNQCTMLGVKTVEYPCH